ncbi:MAG TPA: translation elongation factor Ts [bacterium]|nr:translation elongation factor Ts [bacterium]HPJ71562.1 translation elongation factor Ts [bacterium]HPQ66174.1 translation elongation factor Ts [bacterium]
MIIDSGMVKELREKTGAGIMACKQALQQADGDEAKAVEILRKEGQAKIAKREGRQAREGLLRIGVSPDGKRAALIEFNCETDFVARTPEFSELADWVLGEVMGRGEAAAAGSEVLERIKDYSGKTGEKMELSRALLWEKEGFIGGYLHHNSKVAALVELSAPVPEAAAETAMQVVAYNPDYITERDVPAEVKEKELEIAGAQFADKPPEVRDKIVAGKWRKRLAELCLVDFPYMRDPEMSVGEYIRKEAGPNVEVLSFVRWRLGEIGE